MDNWKSQAVRSGRFCYNCGSGWSFCRDGGKIYCRDCETALDPPGRFPPPPEFRQPDDTLPQDMTAALLARFFGPRLDAILEQLEHLDRQASHRTGLPTLVDERAAGLAARTEQTVAEGSKGSGLPTDAESRAMLRRFDPEEG